MITVKELKAMLETFNENAVLTDYQNKPLKTIVTVPCEANTGFVWVESVPYVGKPYEDKLYTGLMN